MFERYSCPILLSAGYGATTEIAIVAKGSPAVRLAVLVGCSIERSRELQATRKPEYEENWKRQSGDFSVLYFFDRQFRVYGSTVAVALCAERRSSHSAFSRAVIMREAMSEKDSISAYDSIHGPDHRGRCVFCRL